MSCRRSTESHQNNINKSFRIRHDDLKLFSRFLSRRQETSNNSFRVYYGDVSVPFVWESQPGTPKHGGGGGAAAALRPPLTPPPSYYCRSPAPAKKTVGARSVLLRALLTKVSLRRGNNKSSVVSTRVHSPSSPSFSSFSTTTSSSSLSSFSATPRRRRTRRRLSGSGSSSSFDKGIEDISSAEYSGICCGTISMKKVLFSILGRQRQT